MGIAGESGEAVDHIKKALFTGGRIDTTKLMLELGDILFYIANLATECGLSLDHIAQANVQKLRKRYPDGYSDAAAVNKDNSAEEKAVTLCHTCGLPLEECTR